MNKLSHAQWYVGWNYLPIPKLQRGNRWSEIMDNYIHPTLYNGWNYLSMLGLKLENINYWISTPQLQWCNRWNQRMDTLFLTTLYSACNHLPLTLIHVRCFNNYSDFLPRRYHTQLTRERSPNVRWTFVFGSPNVRRERSGNVRSEVLILVPRTFVPNVRRELWGNLQRTFYWCLYILLYI